MKLKTDIALRRDGTVIVEMNNGEYVFKPGEDGSVICDVDSPDDVAYLLNTGYFYPSSDADIDDGIAAVVERGVDASANVKTAIKGRTKK